MSIADVIFYIPACFKCGAWTSWVRQRHDEACRSSETPYFL